MPNAKDLSLTDGFLKMCVYGAPGTGKTHFAGSFPRPYMFDFGTEHRTLIGLDIEFDQFSPNPKKATDTLSTFNKRVNKLWTEIVQDKLYDSIIFDNLTFFSDLLMAYAIQNRSANEAKNADPDKPTQGEWYEVQNKVIATINTLLGFPCNVLFVAHEEDQFSGDGKDKVQTWTRPLVSGKLGAKLDALFDEFYHAEIAPGPTPTYLLRTASRFPYRAKSRSAAQIQRLGVAYPLEIKPPHFGAIQAFMKKAEDAAKAAKEGVPAS